MGARELWGWDKKGGNVYFGYSHSAIKAENNVLCHDTFGISELAKA